MESMNVTTTNSSDSGMVLANADWTHPAFRPVGIPFSHDEERAGMLESLCSVAYQAHHRTGGWGVFAPHEAVTRVLAGSMNRALHRLLEIALVAPLKPTGH
jgi:hypothetical protein